MPHLKIHKGDTSLEKIMTYHIDPIRYPLSPALENIKNRWSEVLSLRLSYHSPQEIVNILVDTFKISTAQAYIDLKNSEILYGNVLSSDKKGKRAILYEYAHKFYQRAMQAKDLKAQSKALELMAKFGGIDDIENMEFNPQKLENNPIQIKVPKEIQKKLIQMLGTGSVDLNTIDVTDIDYEELTTQPDDQ